MGDNVSALVSVVILTFNEARHISRAIASVRPFAKEVLVVDSGSTDETVALAEEAGARVLHHPFVTQARSFQWALDQGSLAAPWTMRLDADEVIEPELQREIAERLPALSSSVAGIELKRKHIFMGRFIRHGGRYPLRLVRIWRTGQGRVEDRWMDEHVVVQGGSIVSFNNPFADANENDLGYFIAKHNAYAVREAIEVLNERYALFRRDEALSMQSGQASLKRRIKSGVYNKIPFQVSASLYLFYRYVLQRGFLDGVEGMIYHVLQGGWYRFLVGARVVEFDRVLSPLQGQANRRAALERLTGYTFPAGPGEGG